MTLFAGLMVMDFVEGETLSVPALRRSPRLLVAAVSAIKTAHEQVQGVPPITSREAERQRGTCREAERQGGSEAGR